MEAYVQNCVSNWSKLKDDICEDDKSVSTFKGDDGIVGKLFPNLPRLF